MRSILIFPEMYNYEAIQKVRHQFDPLSENIHPHVTLVFPFESNLTNEDLAQIVTQRIKDTKSFPVTFDKLGSDDNGYIWLEASHGQERLIKLHDLLYQDDNLKPFLRTDLKYIPHITLGKVDPLQSAQILANLAIKELTFSTYIDQVEIETILDNNDSKIIFRQSLKD